MRKKTITFLCLALLLLVVLAFTYAGERNQAKPSQFKGSREAQSAIKKNRQLRMLKEKMNQSPQYANLPAEQKVRIILQADCSTRPRKRRWRVRRSRNAAARAHPAPTLPPRPRGNGRVAPRRPEAPGTDPPGGRCRSRRRASRTPRPASRRPWGS